MITGPEVVILCIGLMIFIVASTAFVLWWQRRYYGR